MGWASGSSLFDEIIDSAMEFIPDDEQRKKFYIKMIKAFDSQDWDTKDECLGQDAAYDAAYEELYPEE